MGGGWLSALLENGEALETVSGETPAESTEDPRRGSDPCPPDGVLLPGMGGNTRTAPGISSALLDDVCSPLTPSLADSSWEVAMLR